jgi:hypothetical protein
VTAKDYSVVLEGVDARDLSLSVLRDLCDLFLEGAQRSVRLVAEGRSVTRGSVPGWVAAAADVRVSRFDQGSLDLGLRAPRLVDVVADVVALQSMLPSGTDADASAFDLFLDAADDAVSGRRDSERLDAGILDVLARAGSLFARGGTRLRVSRSAGVPIVLDASSAAIIKKLADETPPSQISRVSGILDTLTVSTRSLVLRLEDGRNLRGFAGDVAIEELKFFLGNQVLLEGSVTFRPSGEALRIEVESATAATPGDAIWAHLPKAGAVASRPRSLTPGVGLDAFFGKWPGDETDEQISRALRNVS